MYLFPDDEEKRLAAHPNDQKTVTESSDKQSQDVINSPTQSENAINDIKSDAKPPEKRTDNEMSQQDNS